MKKLILVPVIGLLVLGFVLVKVWATKGDQKAADTSAEDSQSRTADKTADKADNKDGDCGCDKAPPDTYAIINGTKIAGKDVDEQIKDRLQELQNQAVEARKNQLNFEINSRLLEGENLFRN